MLQRTRCVKSLWVLTRILNLHLKKKRNNLGKLSRRVRYRINSKSQQQLDPNSKNKILMPDLNQTGIGAPDENPESAVEDKK